MEDLQENFAFWLMPAAREEKSFATLIEDLALRFSAPIFEPHLTLCGGNLNAEDTLKVMRGVPTQSAYHLEVEEVSFSEQFTKTLFVRFRQSDELLQLRAALEDLVQLPATGPFDPHLSLLYKELPLSEKAELARSIDIPFSRVSFDRVAVIAHPPEIKTREDVEAWRALEQRALAESSR